MIQGLVLALLIRVGEHASAPHELQTDEEEVVSGYISQSNHSLADGFHNTNSAFIFASFTKF